MHIILQYSYEDLLNLVQASSMELQTALQKLQACQIEGKTNYCTNILT
jgi:phage-related protein